MKSDLRKILGTITGSLGLFGLFLSAGTQSALAAESSLQADIIIPVEVVDVCSWALAGAPETITLTPPEGVKYEGAELDISYTFEGLVLGLSGRQDPLTATAGASTDCSFYENILNAQVDFQLTDSATFIAKYGSDIHDPDMNFNLSLERPLRLAAERTLGCISNPTFVVATSGSFYNLEQSPFSLVTSSTSQNAFIAGQGPRCPIGLTLSVTLPASSGIPLGAGYDYSFTGPSLTIQLTGTGN